ncbi:OmpA family protein [Microbacterium foliorum]|uniref:OmpA family protein n=1 Tax=Microbacterium foliorum TaxID=104336 RepID=UPI0028D1EF20|nr:OmpA family protein [Microbacterium foliorum]
MYTIINTMPPRRTSRARALVAIALCASLAPLSACGVEAPVGVSSGIGTLSDAAIAQCSAVFDRTIPDADTKITLIIDGTASTVGGPLPDGVSRALVDASIADGSVTVISVDGEGAAPTIVVEDAALSTPGERDRPSVAELAAVMPACVDEVLGARAIPTAPGTDLYRALALASESVDENTRVFVLTDFVSTTGAFMLDDAMVAQDVAATTSSIAAGAPLDLHGAALSIEGIGNTAVPLLTAHRIWLRDLAVGLCSAWNASGCDTISTDPVNATPRKGDLPDDLIPLFPTPQATSMGDDCLFEAPASLAFAGDSDRLAPDAPAVFADAITLLRQHSDATATIVGHTASSPDYTSEQLIDLANRRATAVASVFTGAGIRQDRIRWIGVGDTQPRIEDLDPGTGLQIEWAAALERRVDVIVVGAPCPA